MARLGILFPGQGAQYPGMGKALWERFQLVRDLFAEASEILGRDIARLCFDSPDDLLRETDTAQPCLYLVGYASWRALETILDGRHTVVVAAGHSLGEYTALAAAGAVSFVDGLTLVAERGRLMRRASDVSRGTMLAILGLDVDRVEDSCLASRRDGGTDEVVVVANDNAPGQVVISGTPDAVARASVHAREMGARRVVPIATGGAFHSPLMDSVAPELKRAIAGSTIGPAACPVVANTTGRSMREAADIRDELTAQLSGRVRWTESVRRMTDFQVDRLVEAAPGQVLAGLTRRIDPTLSVLSIAGGDSLEALADSL